MYFFKQSSKTSSEELSKEFLQELSKELSQGFCKRSVLGNILAIHYWVSLRDSVRDSFRKIQYPKTNNTWGPG
jgi:hypothetical protein